MKSYTTTQSSCSRVQIKHSQHLKLESAAMRRYQQMVKLNSPTDGSSEDEEDGNNKEDEDGEQTVPSVVSITQSETASTMVPSITSTSKNVEPLHDYDKHSNRCGGSSSSASLHSPRHRKSHSKRTNVFNGTSQPANEPDPHTEPTTLIKKQMTVMESSPLLRAQSQPFTTSRTLEMMELGGVVDLDHPVLHKELQSLLTLSYPVITTYVLEFLPSVVSVMLVGHLSSQGTGVQSTDGYVDGVSLSTMWMNLTAVAFGLGLATAMDTLCTQANGAGKPTRMGIYLQSGLMVLGIVLIPVVVLNWYTETFLRVLGQPPAVAALAGRFSRLVLPGIPFLYVYELFKKLLQAQDIVQPMVHIAVLSNVVHIILGVYLTWYTSLGYDGAAIARTMANIVLPLAMIPWLRQHPECTTQWWPGYKWKQAMSHMTEFLTLGVPGMMMMLLEWWAFEIMAALIGLLPHSVVALSVHSVLSNVSNMTFNVFLGISVATNVRVGNYIGSNQPERAKMASTLGMMVAIGVSLGLAMVLLVFRHVLPMVFMNDPTSITLAAHALLCLLPYQLLDALNCVMQGVFRGTARQQLGAWINLCGYFVVGLPMGILLAFPWGLNWGVEGMWLGLTSGVALGVSISLYRVGYTNWRERADESRVRTSRSV